MTCGYIKRLVPDGLAFACAAIVFGVWPAAQAGTIYKYPNTSCGASGGYASAQSACTAGGAATIACVNQTNPGAVRTVTASTLSGMGCTVAYHGVQVSNGAGFNDSISFSISSSLDPQTPTLRNTRYTYPATGCGLADSFATPADACNSAGPAIVACLNQTIPHATRTLTSSVLAGLMCGVTYHGVQTSNNGHFDNAVGTPILELVLEPPTQSVAASPGGNTASQNAKSAPAGAGVCPKSDGIQTRKPIVPATGEELFSHTDYAGSGPDALSLVRSYKSGWAGSVPRGLPVDPGLSRPWSHNHAVSLLRDSTPDIAGGSIKVMFGEGGSRAFDWQAATSSWSARDSADTLVANAGGLLYKRRDDDSAWQFNAVDRLQAITQRNGWVTTYAYSTAGTPAGIAPVPGLLITVSNQFGRTLNFTYNAASQLVSVAAGDGQVTSYAYDGTAAMSRLTTVSYPGNVSGTASKTYLYENSSYPQLITGIIDEIGNRLATITYDSQGRATSSGYAGGADLYSVSYATPGAATVTDPLGTQRTYSYGTAKGKLAVTGADKPGGTGAPSAASRVQDSNGFITQETDFLGVNTMYTWDINRQLPLTKTEAVALPEARTTSTQWHATFQLPVLETEAGRTTAYTYDSLGNRLTMTVTDTATSLARTITWTYVASGSAKGLPATETDPAGVVIRTYAYYTATSFSGTAPNETGYTAGDLQSITNAAGHVTQFTQYDRAGRVRQMVDPNGVVTDIVYTARGWISSVGVTAPGGAARTTSYTYDNAGQLTGATLPDGSTLGYGYDAAQRLTGVTDAKGNTISYTLDAMGNKVGEQVKDPSGNLQRNITRVYDALNRVQQVTGASN